MSSQNRSFAYPLVVGLFTLVAGEAAAVPAALQRTLTKPRQADLSPPASDDELLHQALYACRSLGAKRRDAVDVAMLRQLLALEREHGVPADFRGMTLAKACLESGYRTSVRGDCGGGSCKAVGLIQLWPWTQRFGVDRTDPIASVRFLLERVQVGMAEQRLARICGKKRVADPVDAYRIAWLRVIRGPLARGRQRCEGTPAGLARLWQWQRNIGAARARGETQLLAQTVPAGPAAAALPVRGDAGGAVGDAGAGTDADDGEGGQRGDDSAGWGPRPVRRSWGR